MVDDNRDSLERLPPRSRGPKSGSRARPRPERKTGATRPESEVRQKKAKPRPKRKKDDPRADEMTMQERGAKVASGLRTLFSRKELEPVEEVEEHTTNVISGLHSIVFFLFGVLYVALTHVSHVIGYFVSHRDGLTQYFLDFVKHVPTSDIYTREIRISEQTGYELHFFSDGKWNIKLPNRCIECGTQERLERENFFARIENYGRPLFGICIGLFISTLSSIFFWNFLIFLFSPVAGIFIGMFIGYYLRKRTEVRVEYACCRAHAHNESFPLIRQQGDDLYVLAGHRKVRDAFVKRLDKMGIRNP
ncbi:MAG: hypothetical protein CMJ46_02300 [Planctomyces sp.]|nr:hypothetical protein [Planctomyces sp.]